MPLIHSKNTYSRRISTSDGLLLSKLCMPNWRKLFQWFLVLVTTNFQESLLRKKSNYLGKLKNLDVQMSTFF